MGAPGFDDATMVFPKAGDPKRIQFIYPYYENPQFFERQLHLWESYPEHLRALLRVIVVDDGSPDHPAGAVVRAQTQCSFNLVVFRVDVDVRWNWLAARNIGMHHAHPGWCLLTDMDHMVPADTLAHLVIRAHDPAAIYRLSRRESTGELIHPHPNSMLMTREKFWNVGGYDEALSGFYGTDGDWRRRCAAAGQVWTLPDELRRHEYAGDSSTRKYLRKQPQDAGKKKVLQARRWDRTWKPRVLSFPYHQEIPSA